MEGDACQVFLGDLTSCGSRRGLWRVQTQSHFFPVLWMSEIQQRADLCVLGVVYSYFYSFMVLRWFICDSSVTCRVKNQDFFNFYHIHSNKTNLHKVYVVAVWRGLEERFCYQKDLLWWKCITYSLAVCHSLLLTHAVFFLSSTLFAVPAAPSFVAAVQRGRPPDRTHHTKQEVGHATRGWLSPGSESKEVFQRTLSFS